MNFIALIEAQRIQRYRKQLEGSGALDSSPNSWRRLLRSNTRAHLYKLKLSTAASTIDSVQSQNSFWEWFQERKGREITQAEWDNSGYLDSRREEIDQGPKKQRKNRNAEFKRRKNANRRRRQKQQVRGNLDQPGAAEETLQTTPSAEPVSPHIGEIRLEPSQAEKEALSDGVFADTAGRTQLEAASTILSGMLLKANESSNKANMIESMKEAAPDISMPVLHGMFNDSIRQAANFSSLTFRGAQERERLTREYHARTQQGLTSKETALKILELQLDNRGDHEKTPRAEAIHGDSPQFVPTPGAFSVMIHKIHVEPVYAQALLGREFKVLDDEFHTLNLQQPQGTRGSNRLLWHAFLERIKTHLDGYTPYYCHENSYLPLGLGMQNKEFDARYIGPFAWLRDVAPIDPFTRSTNRHYIWSNIIPPSKSETINALRGFLFKDTSWKVQKRSDGATDDSYWQLEILDFPAVVENYYVDRGYTCLCITSKKGWDWYAPQLELLADTIGSHWVLSNGFSIDDGYHAWNYNVLRRLNEPAPGNLSTQQRHSLECRRHSFCQNVDRNSVDELYGALAKVKGSKEQQDKSQKPVIKPSWILLDRHVPTEKLTETDFSEPPLSGDTDLEDEFLLRTRVSHRANVVAHTLQYGLSSTDRCYVCLRLTKNMRRCSMCIEWCCERSCIRDHGRAFSLCFPCYDKFENDSDAQVVPQQSARKSWSDEEKEFDKKTNEDITDDSDQVETSDESIATYKEEDFVNVYEEIYDTAITAAKREPTEDTLSTPFMAQDDLAGEEEDSIGLDYEVFAGASVHGSPQGAADGADVRIKDTVHWERSIILSSTNKSQWNHTVA